MSESNHATPFEAPDAAALAPLFPGYLVECLIATGGMGAVFKAVQNSLDRPVAIKILPREFGQDQEYRTNFVTEAKTMARLNHPNLVGVYDFGEADGMLFIIMEFVPGKTLFHSAHGIAIAADEAARIVIGVCQALAHAHEHGILHRDIKPSNILLDEQARPKIGDFGLARPVGTVLKDGETIFGTPHYTAPEVLKYPDSVDARADIFSVGVVFHELLTGRLPAADPRPPSLIAGCDPRFDAIIRRATHPSPELRYSSAADMAKEIGVVAAAAATHAARLRAATPATGGRPLPVRTMPVASSGPGNAAGILAFVAVAAAIVIALLIVLRNPAPPPTDAANATPLVTPPPAPKPLPPPTIESVQRPKPEPEPEVFKAKPVPEAEVVKVNPTPVVKPAPPPMPTFDVPGFLDKARSITRQRAAPILAAHAKEIAKNFSAFERRVKREVRDLDKITRGFVETKTEDNLEGWRKDGNRVPKSMELPGGDWRGGRGGFGWGKDRNNGFFDSLNTIHAEYLAKQQKIDDQLEVDMLELSSSIYLLGLRKQIERLTDPNEVPSVKQIQAEIETVQASLKYFIALMRGTDAKAARAAAVAPPGDGTDKNKDG
ncbi:MAG: protein kinase [Verrucomicrobia bacterium]|nr:protein kinase [Verrucomicrobiota bacterium]